MNKILVSLLFVQLLLLFITRLYLCGKSENGVSPTEASPSGIVKTSLNTPYRRTVFYISINLNSIISVWLLLEWMKYVKSPGLNRIGTVMILFLFLAIIMLGLVPTALVLSKGSSLPKTDYSFVFTAYQILTGLGMLVLLMFLGLR